MGFEADNGTVLTDEMLDKRAEEYEDGTWSGHGEVAMGRPRLYDEVKVTVDEPREDGTIVYHLSVAEGDMGRVIGKQGRIAKAIRVVMRAAAVRVDEKVLVEID